MIGVWLIQLGTPSSPSRRDTKTYLDEFLTDPRMIELPNPWRTLLVKGVITPFRSGKTAAAYKKIWMKEGSPLSVYSESFAKAVQTELGNEYYVKLGMRYGEPSIASTWKDLRSRSLERIIVVPLFPQYCSATTASVYDQVAKVLQKEFNYPALTYIPPFFKEAAFVSSFANRAREVGLETFDHFLFSFHGIPERLVSRSSSTCELGACCEVEACQPYCYRAHCVRTARAIQESLGLENSKVSISFQSRLRGEKWLDPYTDHIVPSLAKSGVRRLAVFCPSFVADCLETLEEIGIRAREDFLQAGGDELVLIPSLNESSDWVKGVAGWIKSL